MKPPSGTREEEVTNMRNLDRSSWEKLRSARQNQDTSASPGFQPLSLQKDERNACENWISSLRRVLQLVNIYCSDAGDKN